MGGGGGRRTLRTILSSNPGKFLTLIRKTSFRLTTVVCLPTNVYTSWELSLLILLRIRSSRLHPYAVVQWNIIL